MSEEEIVLMQEAGVKEYDSAAPPTIGFKAGAFAEVGTLILTNRRLVYISKGGSARALAWIGGGALAAYALEKRLSKAQLDDLMKYKGSYSIPLQEIAKVEAARKLGSAYLSVNHPGFGEKSAHSYIFGGGWTKQEDWVTAINSAISAARSAQVTPTTFPSEQVQAANLGQAVCPSCGAAVKPKVKFCTSCGASLQPPQPTTVAPKFCNQCGAQINPASRFCGGCGVPVK